MRAARALAILAILVAACTSAPVTTTPIDSAGTRQATATPVDQALIEGPRGMSLSDEIGMVMMVGFKGPLTDTVRQSWRTHQFGGLLLVPLNENAADAPRFRALISEVGTLTRRPLLVATDQEGGAVCLRGGGVPCLSAARTAGSMGRTQVEAQMKQMSAGLKLLGFNVNLAPVADIWDGVHPIMRDRSYGRDPDAVAADVAAAIAGIHAAGLLAAAKHFPGHGAADGDSHLLLPVVSLDRSTLQGRDWVPFREAIRQKVDFVMVGHLDVPALDDGLPSSLSPAVLSALRQQLGYSGVIISDDLQMAGVTARFPTPEAAVRFLNGGGDMVIVEHDLPVAEATYDAIREAVRSGRYPRAALDASVRRLLDLQIRLPAG